MLVWALLPFNPYGYYILLRIVVFTYAASEMVRYFRRSTDHAYGWIMLGVGITYNPIDFMHLGRPLWSVINLITIVLILSSPPKPNQTAKPATSPPKNTIQFSFF